MNIFKRILLIISFLQIQPSLLPMGKKATSLPPVSLGDLKRAVETINTYIEQQEPTVKTVSILGFGDYEKYTGIFNPIKNTIALTKNNETKTFKNIETQTAHSGTLYPRLKNEMPLIATSEKTKSSGPGSGMVTLYYGKLNQ